MAAIKSVRLGPWKGMNEKVSPDILPKDVAAGLQNVFLDEIPGTVIKRLGSLALTSLPSALPPRDAYVFTKLDGTNYLLVSDGVTLYYTTDPAVTSLWTVIKTGLNTDGFMVFETAEDKVWFCNGIDPLMTWDGTTLLIYDRTYTSTTDATAVTSTTIAHSGLTSAVTDYWKGMKLVFTVGSNIGTVVKITGFDPDTDKLTFTPSVSGVATTDRWVLGVIIPAGSSLRYYDGHLFVGGTASNKAELRFSELSDTNTGSLLALDNPRAWPATNELALTVLDQDRIWGISPIFRDRIIAHKASGLFRIDRDPLTVYRISPISRTIGSRFPGTWAEKNSALYFLGQDKDGLPDIYKTDMVEARLIDPDGGIEPTLRGLQQPNSLFREQLFQSASNFSSGEVSTLMSSSDGELTLGGLSDQSTQEDALVSGANIDFETTPGKVMVIGCPDWEARYEADKLPAVSDPAWDISGAGMNVSVSGGILYASVAYGASSFFTYVCTRNNVFSAGQDAFVCASFNFNSSSDRFQIEISNGNKMASFSAPSSPRSGSASFNEELLGTFQSGVDYVVHILLKSDGTSKLWVNGVLASSKDPTNSSSNAMVFALGQWGSGPSGSIKLNHLYYHSNFKGDTLSSQGGKVSPLTLPDTLPSTGSVVFLNDLTRTPDAIRRLYVNPQFAAQKAVCGTTTTSLTVQLATTTDMSIFASNMLVYLRSLVDGSVIANGSARTIQTVDSSNFRITLDTPGGTVSTSATVGVFDASGDSVSIQSWTSASVDFLTGNDPAGYVAVANGDTPTSLRLRAQRVKCTLTKCTDYSNGPGILGFFSGGLWLSPAVALGQKIAAWRIFLMTNTTPAGTAQTIQMRVASTTDMPVESDWSSFSAITNGTNPGTLFSDTTPPALRWAQIKVEQGPSSSGGIPYVENLVVQWTEGSAKNLPMRAVVHKKRYWLIGATVGAASNNIIVVCDRNDQWTKFIGLNLNDAGHFQSAFFGLSSDTAKILQLDIAGLLSDQGEAIDAWILSRQEAMGNGQLRKNLRYSFLHWDDASAEYTLDSSYHMTGMSTFSTAKTLAMDAAGRDTRHNFPSGTVGKRIQRKYENAVAGEDMKLMGETLYFDVRPPQP